MNSNKKFLQWVLGTVVVAFVGLISGLFAPIIFYTDKRVTLPVRFESSSVTTASTDVVVPTAPEPQGEVIVGRPMLLWTGTTRVTDAEAIRDLSWPAVYTNETNQGNLCFVGVQEMQTGKYSPANMEQLLGLSSNLAPVGISIVAMGSYKVSENDAGKLYPSVRFSSDGYRSFCFEWYRDWPDDVMFAVIEK